MGFAIGLWARRDGWKLSFALLLLGGLARGQQQPDNDADAVLGNPGGWHRYDWLSPSSSVGLPGSKITATSGQQVGDPFAVVSGGSLWQQKYGLVYTQPVAGSLALSYETDAVTLNESSDSSSTSEGTPDDLSNTQKAGLQFQPFQQLTFSGNVHDSGDDSGAPGSSEDTRGSGFIADGHLPFNSELTLGMNSDATTTGMIDGTTSSDDTYDAQLKQPLGKLPLTAQLKGHYEETSLNGATQTRLPSLEQSLVWKPAETTTLQAGLRSQHYQNFPGVTNELNETVFADWAQTVIPDVTWHSYAEVLSTHGTEDLAPAAPTTSGANGTAQSADPTNSMSLPNSFSDETLTFSTGPSFKLDEGVSASIEYSNRIDRNPAPGEVGQEQRVSVSLKGTF
jgi:hypothetical protein